MHLWVPLIISLTLRIGFQYKLALSSNTDVSRSKHPPTQIPLILRSVTDAVESQLQSISILSGADQVSLLILIKYHSNNRRFDVLGDYFQG